MKIFREKLYSEEIGVASICKATLFFSVRSPAFTVL